MSHPPRPVMFVAPCTPEEAAALLPWDHHAVVLHGQAAILLTAHWHEAPDGPHEVHVAVHAAAAEHPDAPEAIQDLVAGLDFSGAGRQTPGAPPARVAKPVQARIA